MTDTEQGGMTLSEAGRRGGNKVLEKYGREHFVKAGRKGGAEVSKEYGREFFSRLGSISRKRSMSNKQKHGE